MGGLYKDKQLIDRAPVNAVKNIHIDPEANHRKKLNGFLARDHEGALKHPETARNLILQYLPILFEQRLARLLFMADELFDDALYVIYGLLFGLAEGDLIRNLEKIAFRVRAFPVEAPGGHAEF